MLALKRRRELKTDYRSRLGMLKSERPRIVIRRSLNGVRLQIVEYGKDGDRTVTEVTSAALGRYGWKAHTGNLPAAYLTGFLLGRVAVGKGMKNCIVDIGLQRAGKGSSLFAAAKGCRDAGMNLLIDEGILPADERIRGAHIAGYAKMMKSEDQGRYRRHFSACIKSGLDPENIPDHFDSVKNRIAQGAEEKPE